MAYTIYQDNCLNRLKTLEAGSVHCAVTSPPYYKQRDYKVSGQLGQEETPQEYIANIVEMCAQLHRVLRDDGTLWLNIGDAYAQSGNGRGGEKQGTNIGAAELPPRKTAEGFKPKDLMLLPHRIAIALQDWGWYVRSDIVWQKVPCMPESVKDRPVKSHEYIFLLSKNRRYFYDVDAVREPYSPDSLPRVMRGVSEGNKWQDGVPGSTPHTISKPRMGRKVHDKNHGGAGSGFNGHSGYYSADGRCLINPLGRNQRDVWAITQQPFSGKKLIADFTDPTGKHFSANTNCRYHAHLSDRPASYRLAVMTIPADCSCLPVEIDHYAVFPETIPLNAIKAGTSDGGCCAGCGKSYRRVVEKVHPDSIREEEAPGKPEWEGRAIVSLNRQSAEEKEPVYLTVGFEQSCKCKGSYPVSCTVLDPFAGSGTTLLVSEKLGRDSIGIELNPAYISLAERRIQQYYEEQGFNLTSLALDVVGL
jgi:DNA modification methylase